MMMRTMAWVRAFLAAWALSVARAELTCENRYTHPFEQTCGLGDIDESLFRIYSRTVRLKEEQESSVHALTDTVQQLRDVQQQLEDAQREYIESETAFHTASGAVVTAIRAMECDRLAHNAEVLVRADLIWSGFRPAREPFDWSKYTDTDVNALCPNDPCRGRALVVSAGEILSTLERSDVTPDEVRAATGNVIGLITSVCKGTSVSTHGVQLDTRGIYQVPEYIQWLFPSPSVLRVIAHRILFIALFVVMGAQRLIVLAFTFPTETAVLIGLLVLLSQCEF